MLNSIQLIYFWYKNRSEFHLPPVFVWLMNHWPVSAVFTIGWVDVWKTLFDLTSFGEEATDVGDDHWLIDYSISLLASFTNRSWLVWRYRRHSKTFEIFILSMIKNFTDLSVQLFLFLNFFLNLKSQYAGILSNCLKILFNTRIDFF